MGDTLLVRMPFHALRFRGSLATTWGDSQGGFQRSALKPLLRGERLHRCVPAGLAGAHRAPRGGNHPRPGLPLGETGKGDQIPCCRRPFCLVRDVFVVFSSPIPPSLLIWQYALSHSKISFPEIFESHPPCRASIRTLNEPLWARCMLRFDFKPRSATAVTGLGCRGAAI